MLPPPRLRPLLRCHASLVQPHGSVLLYCTPSRCLTYNKPTRENAGRSTGPPTRLTAGATRSAATGRRAPSRSLRASGLTLMVRPRPIRPLSQLALIRVGCAWAAHPDLRASQKWHVSTQPTRSNQPIPTNPPKTPPQNPVGFQDSSWLSHLPKKVAPTTCPDAAAFAAACGSCGADAWEHAHRCSGPWVTIRPVIRRETAAAVEAWAAAGRRALPRPGEGDVVIQVGFFWGGGDGVFWRGCCSAGESCLRL